VFLFKEQLTVPEIIAYISIIICVASGIIILVDVVRHPQPMKVMNWVWPLTALYGGPLALWVYYRIGRSEKRTAFWQTVLKGTLHCGSGCTLGDLLSAVFLLAFPVTLFNSKLAGDWTVEYIAAFLIGILFQYYAIKPMKQITPGKALIAALKADTLSLTSWQIGMYGWMTVCNFLIFHHQLKANEPVYWLMMQIGMLCGLITAYPVNWWLIQKGIKETM